jgi:hypothetical protein
MKTAHRRAILVMIVASVLFGCSGIIDGPFSHSIENCFFDELVMVPELLYANNDSGLVTYWDEDTQSYKTYNQNSNTFLAQAVYTRDRYDNSASCLIASVDPRVQMVGNKVMVRSDVMNAELDRLGLKSNIKW